ncbi:MAG: DUF192 domain-containing protein [Candidatus Paceibacterota bacterium]|jgi:hypothetical protein
MKNSVFIIIIFILCVGFLGSLPPRSLLPENIRYAVLAGQSVKVELAITKEAQIRGLSGRSGLPEGEGMLFIFDTPSKKIFWMKDMNFAIDMIWITEGKKVVYIEKNARPESYPGTYFGPDTRVKYVLEVPAGFADKYNLEPGNPVVFTD